MTVDRGRPQGFRSEIRYAVRYERGLAVKALLILMIVAIIVILRALYWA